MLSWLLPIAVAADCGFAATETELHATMEAAELAYAELDVDAFDGRVDDVALNGGVRRERRRADERRDRESC